MAFQLNRDDVLERAESFLRLPMGACLVLLPLLDPLLEVALAMGQRNGHQWQVHVGSGTQCVACQDTQAAGIGGYVVLQAEEHTSELQSLAYLVCRLLLEKKKKKKQTNIHETK